MTTTLPAAQAAKQDPIYDAIFILTEEADSLSECHTRTSGDWTGELEAKARYDQILTVVAALSKLRAPVADERAAFAAVASLVPPCASRRGNDFREGYLEAKVDALRVLRALASAPVAGGACAWETDAAGVTNDPKLADVWRKMGWPVRSLYAAPQASEAVRVQQLEAARIAYASEFPPDDNGDPDVGNIHANIRKLKFQLAALSAQPDAQKEQSDAG